MTFNYNHLYYFYITAKLNGVSAAARHLHTSQSSLSTQLKVLEGHVGRKLLQRSGRKLKLTHDGHIVYSYCKRIFEPAEEMGAFLANKQEALLRRIVIGVSQEIERPFVTDVVARVLRDVSTNQSYSVKLMSSSHTTLLNRLSLHEIDLLLTTQYTYKSEFIKICEVAWPVVLVASPKILEKLKSPVRTLADFKKVDANLVLPTADLLLRHEIDGFIHKSGMQNRVVFESNILSAIHRAVLDGLGFGFLLFPSVMNEVRKNQLRIIGNKLLWSHEYFLLSTPQKARDPFTLELKNALEGFQSAVLSRMN